MNCKNIDFTDYRRTQIYFALFDERLKDQAINKDAYLNDIGISPSSYRRAKNKEQKAGANMVNILSTVFNLAPISLCELDRLERLANGIHSDMYYKIYDKYEFYIKELELLLLKKYTIYPIVELLQCFLFINKPKYASFEFNDGKMAYLQIKRFKKFFNASLQKIYCLLALAYEPYESLQDKEYSAFSYHIMSFRSWKDAKYIECLYYADKAQSILVNELNFRRLAFVNFNVMSSLILLNRYEDCYKLATRQLQMLNSFRNHGVEWTKTLMHAITAALGVGEYSFIINILYDKPDFTLHELSCYMLALSKESMRAYKEFYQSKVVNSAFPKEKSDYLHDLNEWILYPDKNNKRKLANYENVKYILHLIEWL